MSMISDWGETLRECFQDFDAVSAGHHQIGQNNVKVVLIDQILRDGPVGRFINFIAFSAQQLGETLARCVLVFD